jgi:hypothetical protein
MVFNTTFNNISAISWRSVIWKLWWVLTENCESRTHLGELQRISKNIHIYCKSTKNEWIASWIKINPFCFEFLSNQDQKYRIADINKAKFNLRKFFVGVFIFYFFIFFVALGTSHINNYLPQFSRTMGQIMYNKLILASIFSIFHLRYFVPSVTLSTYFSQKYHAWMDTPEMTITIVMIYG